MGKPTRKIYGKGLHKREVLFFATRIFSGIVLVGGQVEVLVIYGQ